MILREFWYNFIQVSFFNISILHIPLLFLVIRLKKGGSCLFSIEWMSKLLETSVSFAIPDQGLPVIAKLLESIFQFTWYTLAFWFHCGEKYIDGNHFEFVALCIIFWEICSIKRKCLFLLYLYFIFVCFMC